MSDQQSKKKPSTWPAYKELAKSGELARRAAFLRDMLKECSLCPNRCGVNRLDGKTGKCRSGAIARVGAAEAHSGEERCISGSRGSGTVFFSACTMRCVYCQNFEISQDDSGEEFTDEALAGLFQDIKRAGCHNLNLVTPTHWLPMIINALDIAAKRGFNLPIAYNTSGYESSEVLDLLDGIVDIYLPDMRYINPEFGRKYSGVKDYVPIAQAAIRQMQDQVGNLVVDEEGVAMRGLIVRHLLLPDMTEESEKILQWLRDEISPRTAISLLTHYNPSFRASDYKEINQKVAPGDIQRVSYAVRQLGLKAV